jgi:hypothetical protein
LEAKVKKVPKKKSRKSKLPAIDERSDEESISDLGK